MARKEEYQKAAYEYINSDAVRPENMQMAYGDFINGAKWADAHPLNPWISVNDRLPEKERGVLSGLVIVWTSNLDLRAAMYNTATKNWLSGGRIEGDIQYWMPIPMPPTQD